MTLSADILNQRSPYKLSQLGEFTFRFVTDQNIHYTVGFYKDTIFMDDGAYHFFIDNSEHEHGSYDSKILDVVTVILEEFFNPLHDMILSYYQDFLKHVPQLYTPREK